MCITLPATKNATERKDKVNNHLESIVATMGDTGPLRIVWFMQRNTHAKQMAMPCNNPDAQGTSLTFELSSPKQVSFFSLTLSLSLLCMGSKQISAATLPHGGDPPGHPVNPRALDGPELLVLPRHGGVVACPYDVGLLREGPHKAIYKNPGTRSNFQATLEHKPLPLHCMLRNGRFLFRLA